MTDFEAYEKLYGVELAMCVPHYRRGYSDPFERYIAKYSKVRFDL